MSVDVAGVPALKVSACEIAKAAAEYQQKLEELLTELREASAKYNAVVKRIGSGSYESVRPDEWNFGFYGGAVQNASSAAEFAKDIQLLQREVRRFTWKKIVNALNLYPMMPPSQREKMQQALNPQQFRYGQTDDPLDDLPPLDEEGIMSIIGGMAASLDQMFEEAVQSVRDWLRPSRWDNYKTNEHNRFKISEKVILTGAVELGYDGKFSVRYYWQDKLMDLDNVVAALDGRLLHNNSYGSPICDAVRKCTADINYAFTEYWHIKCFKNTNIHLEWRRPDLLKEFNWVAFSGSKALPNDDPNQRWQGIGKQDQELELPPLSPPNTGLNFFPTPEHVVRRMLEAAGPIDETTKVLDPSAGDGAILKLCGGVRAAIEVNLEHVPALRAIVGDRLYTDDFLSLEVPPPEHRPDVVLMNPPFSHYRAEAHVLRAWEWLNPGGRLVAIVPTGVRFRRGPWSVKFRDWCSSVNAETQQLPDQSFKESGTSVSTLLLSATKE